MRMTLASALTFLPWPRSKNCGFDLVGFVSFSITVNNPPHVVHDVKGQKESKVLIIKQYNTAAVNRPYNEPTFRCPVICH